MKRFAVGDRRTESFGRQGAIMLLAVGVCLAVGSLGISLSMAEVLPSGQVIENPATTVRTLDPGNSHEPMSEEIWISSDDPPPANNVPSQPQTPRVGPPAQTQAKYASAGVKGVSRSSNLAATILRFRRSGFSKSPAHKPETPNKREILPQNLPAVSTRSAADASKAAEPASGPLAGPEPTAEVAQQPEPPGSLTALSESLKAVLQGHDKERNQEPSARLAPQEEDPLFHTTRSPVKPTALLFPPTTKSDLNRVVAATSQDQVSGLLVPSSPTAEPDVQARLLGHQGILRARTAKTSDKEGILSAIRTSAVAARLGEPPRGGRQPALQIPHTERPPGLNTRKDLPSRLREVKRTAASGGQAPAGGAVVQPTVMHDPKPAHPGRPLVKPTRDATVRHVILRVKLAELDRASATKWSPVDLNISRRPPLLRSLLETGPGKGPIILDAMDLKELNAQLQSLRRRGLVRVRSQPTLVTASGRAAKFITGAGSARSAADPANQSKAATRDLRTEVTLLPVVTDDDLIQLEIACRPNGPDVEASVNEKAASINRADTSKVRLRCGQTLAIGGLQPWEQNASDDLGKRSALAQVLGIGKADPKQTELVMLITPEVIRATGKREAASPGSGDTARSPQAGGTTKLPGTDTVVKSLVTADTVARSLASDVVAKADQAASALASPIVKLWGLTRRKVAGAKAPGSR